MPRITLLLTVIAFSAVWTSDVTATDEISALLEEANRSFAARRFEDAATKYQAIIAANPEPADKAKAVFNLGMTLQALDQFADAIVEYKKLMGKEVDDREPGGHAMEWYRNYHPRAMWQIALCYFELGKYQQAHDAFVTAHRDYPVQTHSGTDRRWLKYRDTLLSG